MKHFFTLLTIVLICNTGKAQSVKTFTQPMGTATAAHLLQNGYVVASSTTDGTNINTITRYRNDGSVAWTKTEQDGLFSRVVDIAENSKQELYMLFEDIEGDSLYGLIKTDTAGNVLWSASLQKRAVQTYDAARISIDINDEVNVLSSTYESALLYKIDNNGTLLSAKNVMVDSVSAKNPAFGMLNLQDGSLMYAGKAGSDLYVQLLDATRHITWTKRIFDYNNSYTHPKAIIALQDGNFLVTGFRGQIGGSSATGMFLLKMDINGTVLEHKFYHDNTGTDAFIPYAMCQLPNGDIRVMGCGGRLTFADFDASLHLQRYSQWGSVENLMVSAGGFSYRNNELLVTGTDENGVSYILRNNLGLGDFCNQVNIQTIVTEDLAIDNKYYDVQAIMAKPPVANYASHTLQNGTELSTTVMCGNSEITLNVSPATETFTANVYPNPVSSNGTLQFDLSWNDESNIVMMDAEGRQVLQLTTTGYHPQLSTGGLTAGMYFLSVSVNENVRLTTKIIVY